MVGLENNLLFVLHEITRTPEPLLSVSQSNAEVLDGFNPNSLFILACTMLH